MNDGGPAFPCEQVYMDDTPNARHSGMTLRDWFAGQALIGLLANLAGTNHHHTELSVFSYEMADAMIAEKEKSK